MKVWIVAGGTGGHFYPGLALAKEFLSQGDNVHFVVRKSDFVLPLLQRENIPFTEISAAGFRRSLHPLNILAPIRLIWGFVESFFAVARSRPDVVVVMGGYLSVPPAVAAWAFRVPVLLHEQNVLPGLANRVLSILVGKVAVSFPDSRAFFGAKAVVTANPLRPEFQNRPESSVALKKFALEPGKKTVLVFGGSLGAHAINKAVLDVLAHHKNWADKIQLLHFSGKQDESQVQKAYRDLPFTSFSEGYCHDMAAAYAASDFVVCRAGASTITELIAVEKPAFLIPYPHATGDHQMKNAEVLSRNGAARVCREGPGLKDALVDVFEGIAKGAIDLSEFKKGYEKIGVRPRDAAGLIRGVALSLV